MQKAKCTVHNAGMGAPTRRSGRRVRPAFFISSRGFSLAELLIVISISSILILSLSAALSGTLGTTAEVAGQLSSWQVASSALLRMERELALATEVVSTEDESVSFYLPDITGDAAADLVQYSWSGTDGDPLVRTVNGTSATTLLPEARAVSFSYNYRQNEPVTIVAATSDLAVVPATFEEYIDYSYESVVREINPSRWRAQRFVPATDSHHTDSVEVNLQTTWLAHFGLTDLLVLLTEVDTGAELAAGLVTRDELLTAFDNLRPFTIPMLWHRAEGSGTSTEKEYRWIFRPSGTTYAGEIERLTVTDPQGPDNRMMYEYSTDGGGSFRNLGHMADVPFVTRGTYVIEYGINAEQTLWRLRRVCVYLRYGSGKDEVAIHTAVRLGNL